MRTFIRSIGLALALVLAAPAGATVPSSISRNDLVGNGSVKVFSFTFPTPSSSWVQVQLAGVVQSSGYAVTLNPSQISAPGGTVTFYSAPAASTAVRIQRVVPFTQTDSYSPYGPFPAKVLEGGLDRQAYAIQQIDRDRADLDATRVADKAVQATRDSGQDSKEAADLADTRAQIAHGALGGGVSIGDASTVLATGTDTSRTLAARASSDWINVLDKGVKCDGSTDDAAKLASAAAVALAGPGGLFVPCKVRIASAAGTITVGIVFGPGGSLDLQTGGTVGLGGSLGADLHQIFFQNGGTLTWTTKVPRQYPQWFGAKGDGVANDTAGLQGAIDASRSTGLHVYAPAGTYLQKSVRLYSGVVLEGAGRAATMFKAWPAMTSGDRLTDATGHGYDGAVLLYNDYQVVPGVNLDGITLRDFTVDGNSSAQTYAGVKQIWGIYLNGVTNTVIENVTAQNCLNHGLTMKESAGGIVRGCQFLVNGQNLVPGFWSGAGAPGGDGMVLISHCTDNLVTDSVATNNYSAGFEDEGRFGGSRIAYNRNARNRWVNLSASGNGDNGFDAIFADHPQLINFTFNTGATSPNAAAIQLLGTTDALVDGARILSPSQEGIRIWQEVWGAAAGANSNGINYRTTVRNTTILSALGRGIVLEGVQGANISATIRGIGGGNAVSLSAVGYGRTGGSGNCTGGYGRGAYQAGVAYQTGSQNGCGQGDMITNAGNLYQLTVAFTGTGLGVTAPTGTTTSADNGGTWTFMGAVGSSDVSLQIDYDGTYGSTAIYGVYAYNPTNLTIRDSSIKSCSSHNVWIDGTTAGATGFRMQDSRSTGSGARGLELTTGALTGQNSSLVNIDLTGNASMLAFGSYASQLAFTNVLGFARTTYSTVMPASGSWNQGDLVFNNAAAAGAPMCWMRITTGAGNVLNTDWKACPNL